MIDKLCIQVEGLALLGIEKNEKMYRILLSDKYGNNPEHGISLFYDIESGKEVDSDCDEFYSLEVYRCKLPKEYRTYRDIIYTKLEENTSEFIKKCLGPYGTENAVNAVFSKHVSGITFNQLYALCNHMVYLILFFCSKEEKSSFRLLLHNKVIRTFLDKPISEKLECVNQTDTLE